MRTVLFHRDFRQFSGGHLKVWHYFNHVLSDPDHDARVRFSPTSVWDDTNPWTASPERVAHPRDQVDADVVFLAGLDWLRLGPRQRRRPSRPVVNLVQHVRHADPGDPRYAFLHHRALRICVSKQVEDAIVATGVVNGPVVTIPNAVDLAGAIGRPWRDREIDVLVVANKRPNLGRSLASALPATAGRVCLLDHHLPRASFLSLLGQSRVSVFLPNETEGFYLPALEGMALGTLVVCPDCVGNRSFCAHGDNCLRPVFDEGALVAAADKALSLTIEDTSALRTRAAATAATHDLSVERADFLARLRALDQLDLVA